MTSRRKTIELQPEDDAFVTRKVDLGEYRSADEVVSAGIQALREREENLDRLLVEEALPALNRLREDPSRGRTIDEVFGRLRSRHETRLLQK
jgi:antitoxin ParD1/3/4